MKFVNSILDHQRPLLVTYGRSAYTLERPTPEKVDSCELKKAIAPGFQLSAVFRVRGPAVTPVYTGAYQREFSTGVQR